MKINLCWESDPEDIYWPEITDRRNLGDDLNAPQRRDDGREFWGYSLINEIGDGDIAFHYHKGNRSILAWSRASGGVWEDSVLWGEIRRGKRVPHPMYWDVLRAGCGG